MAVSEFALTNPDQFDPHSRGLVEALEHLLKQLNVLERDNSPVDGNLGNFIFFPISHLLQKDSLGDRASELVLGVLEFLFKTSWNNSMSINGTKQLMSIVVYLMSGPPFDGDSPPKEFLNISKETKAAGCKALDAAYSAAKNSNVMKFSETFSLTAHNISVLISCLQYSASDDVNLQLSAFATLDDIFHIVGDGDTLSLVLPATVSTCTGLITGRYFDRGTVNYQVIAASLHLLKDLLVMVFSDSGLALTEDGKVSSANNKNRSQSGWLDASKSQVKIALNTLSSLRGHSKKEVNTAFIKLCFSILTKCIVSLDVCIGFCLDTLVFFDSTSEYSDISQEARENLIYLLSSNIHLQSTLRDRVYDWISSLPRLFTSHDEKQPVQILVATQTGIELLKQTTTNQDDRGDVTIELQNMFANILQDAIKLEKTRSKPTETTPSLDLTETSSALVPNKNQYLALDDLGVVSNISLKTEKTLYYLLNYIGSIPGNRNVDEYLTLSINSQDKSSKLISFWQVMALFRGASDIPDDTIMNILSACETNLERSNSMINAAEFDSVDYALISVSLEGLATIAKHVGSDMRYELVDNLYTIVHFLGSSNQHVRKSSQNALVQITQSLGYPNVRALLVENADYLVDGISIKLNTLDISPQTPSILTTLIGLVGAEIVPYLDDLVATMFVILDNYHGYTQLTEGIFQVFRALVEQTYKGYSNQLLLEYEKNDKNSIQSQNSGKWKPLESVDKLINEISSTPELDPKFEQEEPINLEPGAHGYQPFSDKQGQEADSDDESVQDAHPEEDSSDVWHSLIPKDTYMVTERIIGYADRYLTHSSAKLRLNLINLIRFATPILASNNEKFLPSVNAFWPVLISRLKDTDTFILEATLKTIGELSIYAKDFMSRRFDNLWPTIKSFIPNHKTRWPEFSSEQRTLTAVFDCLSKVLEFTPVARYLFNDILYCIMPFIIGQNPQVAPVRDALQSINSDAVWLESVRGGLIQFDKTPPAHGFVEFNI